jgi:hypothetical protein
MRQFGSFLLYVIVVEIVNSLCCLVMTIFIA